MLLQCKTAFLNGKVGSFVPVTIGLRCTILTKYYTILFSELHTLLSEFANKM